MRHTMRQLALPGYELSDYIREAVDFLCEHEPPEGYFVGFSGGKDSIVSLELCRMSGVKHEAYYSYTTIDPPEVCKFIRTHYPHVHWLRPAKSFFTLVEKNSPPLRMMRWCCDHIKKFPSKSNPLKARVMGIRAEESVRRASRPRIDSYQKQTLFKPIFHWPEWAVWEFIESRNMPYPSLYDEGFNRIGCIVCPYIMGTSPGATRQREESMRRWPGPWKAFKHACKRWFDRTRAEGSKHTETWDEYWQAYLRGFE